ncbi:MAG TPA: tetratricopeptide repeat protein [Pyrinomonadaceae bacterium]|jgi:tetratricopeptide (TPR) repeat protein|nr:tetratricopeptide repeat protein [Pyrinomonadaceae bacterium]
METIQTWTKKEANVSDRTVAACIEKWGIDFDPPAEWLATLKQAYPQSFAILSEKKSALSKKANAGQSDKKTIKVLVANFDSSTGENRMVREAILGQLKQAVKNYPDIEIIPVPVKIGPEDDKIAVKRLGEKFGADFVLWGWYSTSKVGALISVNFEVVSQIPVLDTIGSFNKPTPRQIGDLDLFTFQISIGEEYSALVLLTLSLINQEKGSLDDAEDNLTAALSLQNLSKDMLVELYKRRGLLRFNQRKRRGFKTVKTAFSDLEEALKLKPDDDDAQFILGQMHTIKGAYTIGISLLRKSAQGSSDKFVQVRRLLELGMAYEKNGDKIARDDTLNEAKSLTLLLTDFEERTFFVGLLELAKENFTESRKSFFELIKVSDDQEFKAIASIFVAINYAAEVKSEDDEKKEEALKTQALTHLKAAERHLENLESLELLGNLAAGLGDWDLALSAFSTASKLDPHNGSWYILRSAVFEEKKDLNNSLKDLESAINVDFGSLYVHREKARFHLRQKQYDQAISEFNTCISLEDDASLHTELAELYEEKKEFSNARKEGLKAIQMDPDLFDSYWGDTARYRESEKNPDQTLEVLLKNYPSPYGFLELAYLSLKNSPSSNGKRRSDSPFVVHLNTAFDIVTSNPEYGNSEHLSNTCQEIFRAYLREGENENGLNSMNACLDKMRKSKVEPQDLAYILSARGTFYHNSGDYKNAIKDYDDSIKLNPDDSQAFRNRANSYKELGQYPDALKNIDLAMQKDPSELGYNDLRADIFAKMEDFENSRRALLKILETDPTNEQFYTNYYKKSYGYRKNLSREKNVRLLDKIFEETKSPFVVFEKGLLYLGYARKKDPIKDKNYKAAVAEFNRALDLSEKSTKVSNNSIYQLCRIAGLVFTDDNDFTIGVEYLSKCVEILEQKKCDCDELATIYNDRGVLKYRQGAFEAAAIDFSVAINKRPSDHNLVVNRADTYLRQGKIDLATTDVNSVIKEDSNFSRSYFIRAQINMAKGLDLKAIEDLKIAIEKAEDDYSRKDYNELLSKLTRKIDLKVKN